MTVVGVVLVIVASVLLVGMLVGVLVWLVVAVLRGLGRDRSAPPTTRQ